MKILLWCFSLCLCLGAFGQGKPLKPKISYKRTIVFSPLALADIDHTILLGGEYRFSEKFSILADAGYTFASEYLSNNRSSSGFTFRPAARLYTGKRNELFWQAQVLYKQVTYHQQDWLGKACVNEVPSYEEYQSFRFRKKVYGLNIMTGEVMPIGKKVYLEIVAGFGIRLKRHEVLNEEMSCYKTNTVDFPNLYQAKSTTISAPISLRLVYQLK